jgi:serine/threonine protein kinase
LTEAGVFRYHESTNEAKGVGLAKRKRFEDQMLLAPGERVAGRSAEYVVERIAGMGSFGAVYLARDPALPDRRVALKEFFAARHPRERGRLVTLFDRESTVGQLASPHPLMPTFYESFTTDSLHYIAQEFIEGATLDEIIFKRHPLPRDWTLKWAVSLCDALAFLHSCGIVHHDLKPANIRINPQGHLTLLDFGGAQYFGKGHENDSQGDIYGTEGYLPPELEADGQWIADARTDIFALGCILYEMIAGVAPDQESINERSMYVTNSLMQQPNADLGLIRLINKALSYNTEYRYAGANDFLLEVRQIAPPVLLVSRKHLRFGEITKGRTGAPMRLTLYNAGGGRIEGEIKPRAPWIASSPSQFRGNQQNVTVGVDLSRIAERGTLMTGQLEVNTRSIMDANGQVVTPGDRWFVECSVTVALSPGILALADNGSDTLTLAGRRGQTAQGTFSMRNLGDQPVQFTVGTSIALTVDGQDASLEKVTSSPAQGTLNAGASVDVKVAVSLDTLEPGVYPGALIVRAATGQALSVPLSLRVQSPFEALRSALGIR